MTDARPCPGHDCGTALPPGRTLCTRCVQRAERILGDLVAETEQLELTITRQDQMSRRRAHRKKGDDMPLPVNLKASEQGDSALSLLFEWADHVAAAHGVRGMPIRTTGVGRRVELVTRAVGILLRPDHLAWMGRDEQGPDCASAVWWVRRNLRRITDLPMERIPAGPCRAVVPVAVEVNGDGAIRVKLTKSRCELELWAAWGADVITCDGYGDPEQADLPARQRRGCGAMHTPANRDQFLRDAVADQLLPLRLMWDALPRLVPESYVSWETAKKWTQSQNGNAPRLFPRGINSRGVKLYLGADVLALAKPAKRGRRRQRRRSA